MRLSRDNLALYISENSEFHERAKHVNLECYFLQKNKKDSLEYRRYKNLSDQEKKSLAGIFTKSLDRKK